MTKDEWRRLVGHIYNRSISPAFARRVRRLDPFEFFERYPWGVNRLTRAAQALRFIEDYFDDDDDLTKSLTPSFLTELLDSLAEGLRWNERLVVETGVSDAIQSHFAEIVDGMDADDMPEEDLSVMRLSGAADPREELSLLVERVKREKELILKRHSEGGFSLSLRTTRERVEEKKKGVPSGRESDEEGPKKRWLKGLGGIFQGAMLTIVDATLVAGVWTVPVPLETKTVGAVVSMTSGIGSILTGLGDLRGE